MTHDAKPLLVPALADAAASVPAAEEVDVWWGCYASRTMVPSLAVCLLATLLLVACAFVIADLHDLPAPDLRGVVYVLAGVLWGLQTLRWLYRVAGYSYRLTTRRLFCCWGFLRLAPPIELALVSAVILDQTVIERLLNAGRIRLELVNGPAVTLLGVANPAPILDTIRQAVKKCRETAVPGEPAAALVASVTPCSPPAASRPGR